MPDDFDPLAGLDGDLALEDATPSDPVPDPLGEIEWTGDAEADSLAEADAIRTAFLSRAKGERERFVAATDSEYWCCLCFQSREQKEAFLRAMKWLELGDKYLDGRAVARRQGVALPEARVPFARSKADRLLDELSLPLE